MARRCVGLIVVLCLVWCAAAFADANAPTNTEAPTITGDAISGQTLSVSTGTWTGTQPISYSYQWERCDSGCAAIPGATNSSYTLTHADVDDLIQAVVTATNSAGTAGAASDPVGAVAPSGAEIDAALAKVPRLNRATLRSVVKNSRLTFSFTPPGNGKLTLTWSYVPRGTHKPVIVASARADLTGEQTQRVTLRLTAAGRQARRRLPKLRLVSRVAFTPAP